VGIIEKAGGRKTGSVKSGICDAERDPGKKEGRADLPFSLPDPARRLPVFSIVSTDRGARNRLRSTFQTNRVQYITFDVQKVQNAG